MNRLINEASKAMAFLAGGGIRSELFTPPVIAVGLEVWSAGTLAGHITSRAVPQEALRRQTEEEKSRRAARRRVRE